MHKPVTKSRTNRAVAVVVGIVVLNAARRHFGGTLDPAVETLINEEVVPAIVALGGAAAMWFRQQATKG